MEGAGNSLGILAAAATQDAASTAAKTKESIFRDVQAFLDGAEAGVRQRDAKLAFKDDELAKLRIDVMQAKTAATGYQKKGDDLVICILQGVCCV
jgi:hypothetical protein